VIESVPLDDRGLLLGDGLFETLLWRGGELVLAGEHAQRMQVGAATLGLPAPTLAEFVGCATAAVGAAGLKAARAAVRVTLTAGSGGRGLDRPASLAPRLFATAAVSVRPDTPARLIIARTARNQASPASRLKTLAYLDSVLARREAMLAGADEAVMLNTRGELACAAAASLFWVSDSVIFTPSVEAGCLDGIMARQVIAAAARLGLDCRQVLEGESALAAADAIFITNSLIGLRPAYLADRPYRAHPIIVKLMDALAAVV
jgi:branched-chain amino acid aminotransferase/4-amino-4-deoxychorismate lyase